MLRTRHVRYDEVGGCGLVLRIAVVAVIARRTVAKNTLPKSARGDAIQRGGAISIGDPPYAGAWVYKRVEVGNQIESKRYFPRLIHYRNREHDIAGRGVKRVVLSRNMCGERKDSGVGIGLSLNRLP